MQEEVRLCWPMHAQPMLEMAVTEPNSLVPDDRLANPEDMGEWCMRSCTSALREAHYLIGQAGALNLYDDLRDLKGF
jgi:hypothetical protein